MLHCVGGGLLWQVPLQWDVQGLRWVPIMGGSGLHQKWGEWCSISIQQKRSCVLIWYNTPPIFDTHGQYWTIHCKKLVTTAPPLPTHHSLLLGLHHSPHFDTYSSLLLKEWVIYCGGRCCSKFITMKCARFSVSVKNGGSDVAAQNYRKHILQKGRKWCIVQGGGDFGGKFLKLKRAILTLCVKNGGSDVAAQNAKKCN